MIQGSDWATIQQLAIGLSYQNDLPHKINPDSNTHQCRTGEGDDGKMRRLKETGGNEIAG